MTPKPSPSLKMGCEFRVEMERGNSRRLGQTERLLIACAGVIVCAVANLIRLTVPAEPASNSSAIPAGSSKQVQRVAPSQSDESLDSYQVAKPILTEPGPSPRNIEAGIDPRQALQLKVEMLKKGKAVLEGVQNYSAHLVKREMVHGHLLGEQSVQMKFRKHPFSVYLRWTKCEAGREVIYVEGKNDGKLIAHDGGWKARIPAFNLHPDCRLAMSDSRYPVTNAGILFVVDKMLDVHEHDLQMSDFESCAVGDQEFDGHSCLRFTVEYKSRQASPTYRKAITLIDRDTNILLDTAHYEWPGHAALPGEQDLDEATLIESYSYYDLNLQARFGDLDFDPKNPEYQFH